MVKNNFYSDLFEKGYIDPVYKTIGFKGQLIYNNETDFINADKIHSFSYFPDYLDFSIPSGIKHKRIFQKKGYAASLSECTSVEDYITKNCKTNFRGNIRRPLKRFETSLNVTDKVFFGDIKLEEYQQLMKDFRDMLEKRFEVKTAKNLILDNWEFYSNQAYKLIKNKKASLFVLFDENAPIAFSLNFHFGKVFYFAIPTFDLDYSKFTLGNIVIYKNIKWCFENGYDVFDMGYGGFKNKINWCNTTYNFEHHVFYKNKKAFVSLYSLYLKNKYKIINYLIAKEFNTKFRKLKNGITRQKSITAPEYNMVSNSIDSCPDSNSLIKVDINSNRNKTLKKTVLDFLYHNKESINNVTLYKVTNDPHSYIVKGKNTQQKIQFLKH